MAFLLIMVASWLVVQSTWLERERESSFFQRERAFKGEREREIQEDGAFKSARRS